MKNKILLSLDVNEVILELESVIRQLKNGNIEPTKELQESINKLFKIRNEIYPIWNYDGRFN